MTILQILILAVIQGFAELLPVSSSAHVITAEKLMGLDPTSPELTFLLVMLHTGTMFAVIVYFWKAWKSAYFSSVQILRQTIVYYYCVISFGSKDWREFQRVACNHFSSIAEGLSEIRDAVVLSGHRNRHHRYCRVGIAAAHQTSIRGRRFKIRNRTFVR
jgi:hypothetical protein